MSKKATKKYLVGYTLTFDGSVEVEAKSAKGALRIAEATFSKGDAMKQYDLSYMHFDVDDIEEAPEDKITIKTATIDGKKIAYTSETEFVVQVGRDRGSYKTRATFQGDLARAIMHYQMINIGLGHKKRLLMPSSPNPVIARQLS